MARTGVTLDMDVYWMPQTITSGGKNEASGSWGNAVATLNVDTGKAGLWPGGCWRRSNFDPLCRPEFDPGLAADHWVTGCG